MVPFRTKDLEYAPQYETMDGSTFVSVHPEHNTTPRTLLAAARCLVCLWFLSVQLYDYVMMTEESRVLWSLSFFTVWNYHIQILCFFVLAANSVWTKPGPKLRLCGECLFELCLPMSILVSGVLWGLLMPASNNPSAFLDFSSINQHLVNTVLLLAEFCVNRLLVRIEHVGLVLLWPASWMLYIWIQHAYSDLAWPYFFMELNAIAPVWYGALLVFHVVVYLVMAGLSVLKQRKWGLTLPYPVRETSVLSEEIPTRRGF